MYIINKVNGQIDKKHLNQVTNKIKEFLSENYPELFELAVCYTTVNNNLNSLDFNFHTFIDKDEKSTKLVTLSFYDYDVFIKDHDGAAHITSILKNISPNYQNFMKNEFMPQFFPDVEYDRELFKYNMQYIKIINREKRNILKLFDNMKDRKFFDHTIHFNLNTNSSLKKLIYYYANKQETNEKNEEIELVKK